MRGFGFSDGSCPCSSLGVHLGKQLHRLWVPWTLICAALLPQSAHTVDLFLLCLQVRGEPSLGVLARFS